MRLEHLWVQIAVGCFDVFIVEVASSTANEVDITLCVGVVVVKSFLLLLMPVIVLLLLLSFRLRPATAQWVDHLTVEAFGTSFSYASPSAALIE